MFSKNLQHVKLQNFLSIRLKHSGLSDDTKTSKLLSNNCSQYNIEKLIRTLSMCEYVFVTLNIIGCAGIYLKKQCWIC